MLQTKTVEPALLELLKKLMANDFFNDFNLVGGTSLALQMGHRSSIDIDLFGPKLFDKIELIAELKRLGEVIVIKQSKFINIFQINGIKVDFVTYDYPLLDDVNVVEGIRLASQKDVAAMKINAITGRGSKKDFIDLYFLLNKFSLKQIIDFYENKYDDGSVFMALKSLTYFEDADDQIMPKMFDQVSWEDIKATIRKKYLDYVNNE